MKLNRFQKILPLALLTAVAAEPTLAAAGTQSVTNFFNTIQGTLQTVSLVVVTISVMWAGFRVLFMGNAFQEVAKPLLGGIMIGSAGWIASLFVGRFQDANLTDLQRRNATGVRNGHPDQAVCSSLRPGALAGLLAMDAAHSVGARGAAHHVADHGQGRSGLPAAVDQLANPSCRAAQQAPLGIGRKSCTDRLQT